MTNSQLIKLFEDMIEACECECMALGREADDGSWGSHYDDMREAIEELKHRDKVQRLPSRQGIRHDNRIDLPA
jgi:hypothetical protein